MADERNALAELAGRLNKPTIRETKLGGFVEVYDPSDIKKVSRIVAELAKEQDEEAALFSMENITADEARRIVRQREGNCILKCRMIAGEQS